MVKTGRLVKRNRKFRITRSVKRLTACMNLELGDRKVNMIGYRSLSETMCFHNGET